MFIEPGFNDNVDGDPCEVSDAQTMINYLTEVHKAKLEVATESS